MKPALISIVIPVYNSADFLEETLRSVFQNHYPHFEVILVNDGSKDQSKRVCKEWTSRYPEKIVFLEQENQGPSVARNFGIDRAQGKYILPLDSDDKIHPDYLIHAIQTLEHQPETKVVYCEAEKFGAKSGHWKLKDFSLKSLAKDNMIFVSGVFRKSDWKKVGGYDPRFRLGWEDWEFWINLLKNGGQVVKLPMVGFYYRIRGCSRRKSTSREAKMLTIQLLNRKHPEFFTKYLNGPIHYRRSLSLWINFMKNLVGTRVEKPTPARIGTPRQALGNLGR